MPEAPWVKTEEPGIHNQICLPLECTFLTIIFRSLSEEILHWQSNGKNTMLLDSEFYSSHNQKWGLFFFLTVKDVLSHEILHAYFVPTI